MTAHISTEPARRAEPATFGLPAAPATPGLVFRGFRSIEADVPGMGAANQAARTAAGERYYDGILLLGPDVADPRVARALLDWSEGRRLDIATTHLAARDGLDRPWFLTDFQWDGNPILVEILRASGYER